MEKVRALGTKADDTQRNNIRVDSERRQGMIATAREWIFKKGRSVTSKVIDRFLNFSMVPIRVSSSQNLGVSANVPIERVLGSPLRSRIQLLSNVCCRSFTRFRARCLEECFQTFNSDALCPWQRKRSNVERTVRSNVFVLYLHD